MQHLLTILILLILLLPALVLPAAIRELVPTSLSLEEPRALWLSGGLLAGMLTCLLLRRSSRLRFLTTLLHEHAHLTMALLLGTNPKSLSAVEMEGLFQYELGGGVRKVRAFFITLAPYFFSPLLIAPVVLAWLLPTMSDWRTGFLTWLLGLCLALPLAEIHPRQPDLKAYGVVPAIVVALGLWASLAALTLTLVESGSMRQAAVLFPRGGQLLLDWLWQLKVNLPVMS